MNNNLSKYILATITYYDVMDYPMTVFEIWKYLTRITNDELRINNEADKYSLADIINELESEKLKKVIEKYRGFYFIKGRKNLVVQRIERNKISEKKLRVVVSIIKILRLVPFIKSLVIVGRLAMKNGENKSDMDILVILKSGKIFTGRALITLAVQLIGKRRYKEKIKDRICLNHFITEDFSVSIKDIFSANEYAFAMPIFGSEVFRDFQTKNIWINNFKSNYGNLKKNILLLTLKKQQPLNPTIGSLNPFIPVLNFV